MPNRYIIVLPKETKVWDEWPDDFAPGDLCGVFMQSIKKHVDEKGRWENQMSCGFPVIVLKEGVHGS